MRLSDLRDRRVAVWGTGREGVAAVRTIAALEPADLVVVDDLADSPAWELSALAPLRTDFDALAAADVVVRSPGIAQTHPWVIELRRRGVRITGGTALWLADHATSTIGVTGSKGKSTTASLTSHLLAAVGRPNVLGGNIGIAVLDLPSADRYVVELSVYQCADLGDSPRIVALTSLYPEHLDWSGGEEAYYRDKLNVVAHGPERVVADGAVTARLPAGLPVFVTGRPDTFHVGPEGFRRGPEPLFPREALPLVGRHNEANLCVALGVLEADGVDCVASREVLAASLRTFRALEHRLTPIEDPSGITFVDDSIATIPEAAIHAIEAYADRPLTVIVGGHDRGLDYTPLRDFLASRGITATVIGVPDSGPRILSVLDDVPTLSTVAARDLVEAVRLARERTPAGGVVLLSPAAPSYGRFDNFEHRSRVFRQAIQDTAARLR